MVTTRPSDAIDWKDLLARHGPMLCRTACRILGQPEEAEDCLQDVILELLGREKPLLAHNWAAVLRWMVVRRALDRLRARRAAREVHPESMQSLAFECSGSERQGETREMLIWLRWAVSRLPPRRAQVFALRYFAEMSYADIAAILGIEAGAAGVILHEARQQLQRLLPAAWVNDRKVRCGRAES